LLFGIAVWEGRENAEGKSWEGELEELAIKEKNTHVGLDHRTGKKGVWAGGGGMNLSQ